jgi:predicted negative regulator of RcsB-dependent stress response
MNQNLLVVLIGVLAACAIGFGYLYYQERQSGVEIKIDENGVSIDGK